MIIHLRAIHTDDKAYTFVENLYLSAFPEEERREVNLQRTNIDSNNRLTCYLIEADGALAGFFTSWDMGNFRYIEHLAVSPEMRCSGVGGKALAEAFAGPLAGKPIVIEVELPLENLSRRRIDFYKRINFKLWEKQYIQPPYDKSKQSGLEMRLMVRGSMEETKDFKEIQQVLYREVYGIRNATDTNLQG